jgi:hypothetical protein
MSVRKEQKKTLNIRANIPLMVRRKRKIERGIIRRNTIKQEYGRDITKNMMDGE